MEGADQERWIFSLTYFDEFIDDLLTKIESATSSCLD